MIVVEIHTQYLKNVDYNFECSIFRGGLIALESLVCQLGLGGIRVFTAD
jgi:hypothetical protein